MEERSHRHILNLVTQMAVIGLSGNEIGCALIPMMARNISSTLRPNTLTHDQHHHLEIRLATHGRSIHKGQNRSFSVFGWNVRFWGQSGHRFFGSERQLLAATSIGRRNTCVKSFRRRFKLQRFAWPFV